MTRIFAYGFTLLAAVHSAMTVWATKGPAVWVEWGGVVWTRDEVYLGLTLGYALLATFSWLMVMATEAHHS